MWETWLSARADEIQGYADKNDMENFYSSLMEVYSTSSAVSSLLLSADGTKRRTRSWRGGLSISMVY